MSECCFHKHNNCYIIVIGQFGSILFLNKTTEVKIMSRTKFIAQSAVIAAAYAGLTVLFAPISYGGLQVRVSEILTVLPFFTAAAIPGLFIGCMVANIFSPNGIADIIAGSLATLAAAALSYYMPKKWLVPMPPVMVNAIVIGVMLGLMYNSPIWAMILYVAAGQAIACYAGGYPLLLLLNKFKDKIF
jgi:uncharacterized membrane protein